MNVVLVGAGNLATNLGAALLKAGHRVEQVYSRTEDSALTLAEKLECGFTTSFADIRKDTDIYIVSLKDTALEKFAETMTKGREKALWVHTAGSIAMDVFKCPRRGVLYPMQTFSKSKDVDFSSIPFFIEAADERDLALLRELAGSMSGAVYEMNGEDRRVLHLAAVFCCNFANHCYALGAELLKSRGIPFEVMLPLIDETAGKLHRLSPKKAQTGPAVRFDSNVMDKHKVLLEDRDVMLAVYELMSGSIYKMANE